MAVVTPHILRKSSPLSEMMSVYVRLLDTHFDINVGLMFTFVKLKRNFLDLEACFVSKCWIWRRVLCLIAGINFSIASRFRTVPKDSVPK
jgi:hypothetical protein